MVDDSRIPYAVNSPYVDPLSLGIPQMPLPMQAPNICARCGKSYKHRAHLKRHIEFECGILPRFKCHYCPHKSKRKSNMETHVLICHKDMTLLYHVDSE